MSEQLQLAIANFRKDSYITVEGRQKVDCFFIIQQGNVRVTKEVPIEGDKDEMLVPGDFFGVVSAMSSLSHIETTRALTDVTLVTVRPQQYVPLINRNAQVAVKILMQLSNRLRFLDDALTKITLKNSGKVAGDSPSRLFDVAEYYFKQKQHDQAFYAYTQYIKYCPDGKNFAVAESKLKDLADRVEDAVRTEHEQSDLNRTYGKGQMIFTEGELGNEFFVLQSGAIKISKIIDNKEILMGTLKVGDIFGEMAILENKPRAASALASEDSSVMAVSKANFDSLIKTQPQLISKLTTLLSNRIWLAFRQLEVHHIINPLGRIYGSLIIQLEKSRINFESTGPHVFSTAWEDIINMLGFTEKEGFVLMGDLHRDKNIQVRKGRVHIHSIKELVKQNDFFRKMDVRKKAQQDSRIRNQFD